MATKAKQQAANDAITGNLAIAIADVRMEIDAIKNRLDAPTVAEPVEAPEPDPEIVEDMLVGAWIAEQRDSGAVSIDLAKLDDIRLGIRLALA